MPLISASKRTGCLHPIEGHAQILPGHVVSKNLSLKSAVLAIYRLQVHRETKSQEFAVRKQRGCRQTGRVWHCQERVGRTAQPGDSLIIPSQGRGARPWKDMKNIMGAPGLFLDIIQRVHFLLITFLKTPLMLPVHAGTFGSTVPFLC